MGHELLPQYIDWNLSVEAFKKDGDLVFSECPGACAQGPSLTEAEGSSHVALSMWCVPGGALEHFYDFAQYLIWSECAREDWIDIADFLICVSPFVLPDGRNISRNDINPDAESINAVFSPERCADSLALLQKVELDAFSGIWREFISEASNSEGDSDEDFRFNRVYFETPESAFRLVEGFVELLEVATENGAGIFFYWSY